MLSGLDKSAELLDKKKNCSLVYFFWRYAFGDFPVSLWNTRLK